MRSRLFAIIGLFASLACADMAFTKETARESKSIASAVLERAHDDYQKLLTDKFAGTSDDTVLLGKQFVLRVPVKNGQIADGQPSGPYYVYEDGELRLTFSLNDKYAGVGIDGPKYSVGGVGGNRIFRKSYVGSNAFGVRARVQVYEIRANAVAFVGRPNAEASPYLKASDLEFYRERNISIPRDTYWVALRLSGPVARSLSEDVDLEIEGVIAPIKDGKPTYCEGQYVGGRIDSPTEIFGSECWIGAKVVRVAFIRRSTGDVIKMWGN